MNADWYKDFFERLEKSKNEISKSDFRFYNFSHLPLIAKKTLEYCDKCDQCKSNINSLDELSRNFKHYLNSTINNRKEFDTKLNAITKHLRKEHQIRFAFYYSSLYSFTGLLAGLLAGGLFLLFLPVPDSHLILLLSAFLGLAAGRIAGYLKDKKIYKNNKQI